MTDFYILLAIFLLGWFFVYQRNVAEKAKQSTKQYCEKNGLQFISLARIKTRMGFNKRLGLFWTNHFEFEFSGDGESAYVGTIALQNLKVINIDLPPFRV